MQHQYECGYWERHHHWEYTSAALLGSSYYKLPVVLQWFSGNIGYHHVHHLSSKIPNYHLKRCHESHELFQKSKVLTLWSSLKCAKFRLWDESNRELVGYRPVPTSPHSNSHWNTTSPTAAGAPWAAVASRARFLISSN